MKLFLRRLISRPWLQPLWRLSFKLSLAGLNIGGGYGFDSSGEINALKLLGKFCASKDSAMILDVGAHRGEYADAAACLLGKKAVIHCFEPCQDAFDLLSARFNSRPGIHCHQTALGASETTGLLIAAAGESTTGYLQTSSVNAGDTGGAQVRVVRLDQFCEAHQIDLIDLLKLDVEGGEYDVLKGAGAMLSEGRIRLIQFEFGEPSIRCRRHLSDLFDLLARDYRIYRILQKGFAEIKSYCTEQEIFKCTNFLAECRKPVIPNARRTR